MDEETRTQRLVAAERRAEALFDEVVRRELIAPGRREQEVSDDVRDLAAEVMGTSRFWHKRVVRAGPNTLEPYRENPPDREIAADDVVFLDLGPIFAPPGSPEWEADLGRTYVLGDDPVKHRLRDDLGHVFAAGREYFETHPDITGEQLYAEVVRLAEEAGWAFGGPHSGHLVGEFPHQLIDEDRKHSYITPGNDVRMRTQDPSGRDCHWILEVHLVDHERRIGGFVEQLLTLQGAAPPA